MNRTLILAASYALLPLMALAEPSHCHNGEEVLFNCQVRGTNRSASICGANYFARDESFLDSYVQYRFGPIGSIEFVYPSTTAHAAMLDVFRASASRAADFSFSDSFFSFKSDGYIYEISYREEQMKSGRQKRSASVSVWKAGKRGVVGEMHTLNCRAHDNKNTDLYMQDIVGKFSSPGVKYWEKLN